MKTLLLLRHAKSIDLKAVTWSEVLEVRGTLDWMLKPKKLVEDL